ncbi:BatA domain-containing protein [Botrimarina mediterranea]|uniref:Aerotolerance regulator N-terminal domain-containing protein n=1 Tax=Botrimarina mediterranea TaxID=2528022 RepID=A0A518KC96_9BACT|nr:BatA domain-containing protein [Botrimarina mediterranea]QDV75414.1 hypothetical protein Spa11_36310 [Botrimarina mediterranea]QDV80047.1 hypothetical protein K2D_36700 [Planctomycetes bacterium K2D]
MSFLQPWLLWALPIAGLPILIHLINQRRYRTVEWGAMQFLLAANQMSRGFARVRQWLILAMRVLAIAGLLFAISRPLASGWLGLAAGSKTDTTVVLLDCSPSMQRQEAGVSKLDTARRHLADVLSTLSSNRWVLIDSASETPLELEASTDLLESPHATGVSASADLPAMMQSLYDYIKANNPGHTEVWIASDLRESDWQSDSGRWTSLREALLEFPQEVRFHLLNYGDNAANPNSPPNLSVRVTEARRVEVGSDAELLVSVLVTRDAEGPDDLQKISLPIQFEVDGARTQMRVELSGVRFELKDQRIPLAGGAVRGWGRVSLPADINPADDNAYFVFDKPAPRRTVVIADNADTVRPLSLAASIAPDAAACPSDAFAPDALQTLAWEELALVLWTSDIPTGKTADALRAYVDRGGQVMFFPSKEPTSRQFLGVGWEAWQPLARPATPDNWRGDQDLLANTASGASLPVGRWEVSRSCSLAGEFNTLASLPEGKPLLARVPTNAGGVYFLATTVSPSDSTLAADGVVLYVAMQRAIEAGLAVLGDARSQSAGTPLPATGEPWLRRAGDPSPHDEEALSTSYAYRQGVYSSGEKLLAINRPVAEDQTLQAPSEQVQQLFTGLDFDQVDTSPGADSTLVQEVWRIFLGAMMLAMALEAGISLPRVPQQVQAFAPRVGSPRGAPPRALEEVA